MRAEPPQGEKSQLRWDIRGVLNWTVPFLKGKGIASARLDCELLLCEVLTFKRIDLYTQIDRPLSLTEQQEFGKILRRRVAGEPMAYIMGRREFMGHSFQVSPAVLIPRPETELLVEEVVAFLQTRHRRYQAQGEAARPLRVLDVGTGSGCIAISIAKACPEVEVTCWDISAEALKVAAENARQLQVSERLQLQVCDALEAASWPSQPYYDAIVSNPPYIACEERGILAHGVVGYEPELALFAAANGLAFYLAMAQQARGCLLSEGRAFWEVGYQQRADVCQLLTAAGWGALAVKQDYSSVDRIISASPYADA